jgi:hypothetical protein
MQTYGMKSKARPYNVRCFADKRVNDKFNHNSRKKTARQCTRKEIVGCVCSMAPVKVP